MTINIKFDAILNRLRESDAAAVSPHDLVGSDHNVTGLTPGDVLTALTATTFGFAAAAAGGLDFSKVVLLGCNPSTVGGPAGILGSYTTIQAALDAVPKNTTADLGTRTHIILVPPGTYDEDLTIAIEAKKIVMVAMGMVNLGKMTGSSNVPAVGDTKRGITIDPPHDWDINGVRSSFHMMSFTGHVEAMETHPSYASKWRFSGLKFAAGSQGVGWEITISDCEIFADGTSGLAIDGTLVSGGYPMLYGYNSRIRAGIDFVKADLSYFHRTAFNGNISCRSYSYLESCSIDGDLTVTNNGWWTPSGIIDSQFASGKTFTGPAGSLIVDPFTDWYVINNTLTLAGGATKVVRQGAPGSHQLDGSVHTVSGLTTGNILQATSATTAAFGLGQFIDLSKITVVAMNTNATLGAVGVLGTYTTIQAALNAIPAATSNDEATRVHYVYVPGGTYDEALTYDVTRKRAVLVAMGLVNVGKFSGANWTPSGDTYRNFTIQMPNAGNFNSIRHSLHLCSWTPHIDKSESHMSYSGGWRFNGTCIGLNGAVSTGCEINFSDVEFYGDPAHTTPSASIDWSAVGSVTGLFYAHKCRFRGDIHLGSNFELVYSERTAYNGNVTARSFSFLWGCEFSASKTFTITTATGYYTPNGFAHCAFGTGYTFSGPASSFIVDSYSDWYAVNKAITLSGGATKIVRDGIVSSDGSLMAPVTAYVYLGSESVDGSWRFGASGSNLVIQKRETGSWVTKSTIQA